MVRFFGKPRKEAAAGGTPARVASTPSRAVKLEALPAPAPVAEKPEPKPRRRTSARPPRRDWAAEAAATPADVPAPPPASHATGEETEPAGALPAKRRRGTRGGRGRKKPGQAAAEAAPAAAPGPKQQPVEPLTIEQALARQTAALEAFTTQMAATLNGVQAAVAGLDRRLDQRPDTAIAPRVGIFVDVPNVIYASERRGVSLDFGKVLAYFTRGRELVRATAYAPISDDPSAKLESQRFAHHFIGQPYRLVTKPLKRFADGSMKANFDIELAVDILTMSDRLDVVVLMSGDGDFRRVVELVASRGVRVEVAAFSETAALELKSVADLYIDLADHVAEFRSGK
ncbi:MAG: LabA-like NYN domain-containing protein [Dehalococcoidia bacterium]